MSWLCLGSLKSSSSHFPQSTETRETSGHSPLKDKKKEKEKKIIDKLARKSIGQSNFFSFSSLDTDAKGDKLINKHPRNMDILKLVAESRKFTDAGAKRLYDIGTSNLNNMNHIEMLIILAKNKNIPQDIKSNLEELVDNNPNLPFKEWLAQAK